jgi:hypothetical protein
MGRGGLSHKTGWAEGSEAHNCFLLGGQNPTEAHAAPARPSSVPALLRKRGHSITVAADGREALAILLKEEFGLVLMDIQMPEMGGLEATAAIREREDYGSAHPGDCHDGARHEGRPGKKPD